jgi:hypothetical protein
VNVTVAPGASEAGVALKVRTTGPASAPPLPEAAEAVAGRRIRTTRNSSEARITPLMSANRQLL